MVMLWSFSQVSVSNNYATHTGSVDGCQGDGCFSFSVESKRSGHALNDGYSMAS